MAGTGTTNKKNKDKEMAARMKRLGIVRTTMICPVCYRTVSCESNKSRYTHVCAKA